MKVDALLRLVSAEIADERGAALRVIRGLVTLQPSTATKGGEDLEDAIRDALFRIGVPDSLLGHRYLVPALSIAAKDSDCTRSIAKYLYPVIARQYNATASRVERAIRHTIEVGCDRGDYCVRVQNHPRKPQNIFFVLITLENSKPVRAWSFLIPVG